MPITTRTDKTSTDFGKIFKKLEALEKKIDEKGESGQTFWGMLAWVKRTRPSIVVQENVCSAPWEEMVGYYAKEGYAATFLRVDTKNHYIPHTRTRVYLLAIDAEAANRRAASAGTSAKGANRADVLKPRRGLGGRKRAMGRRGRCPARVSCRHVQGARARD